MPDDSSAASRVDLRAALLYRAEMCAQNAEDASAAAYRSASDAHTAAVELYDDLRLVHTSLHNIGLVADVPRAGKAVLGEIMDSASGTGAVAWKHLSDGAPPVMPCLLTASDHTETARRAASHAANSLRLVRLLDQGIMLGAGDFAGTGTTLSDLLSDYEAAPAGGISVVSHEAGQDDDDDDQKEAA